MHCERLRKFWFKVTNWESWHYHVKYIPIAPVWLWYCLKARSFWFFTASNPSITFGGFEGEGKREIYNQLPENSFPKSIYIRPEEDFSTISSHLGKENILFPLVVKPDVGAMGYLFRKIQSLEQLKEYHTFIDEEYIIQEWIDYPIEISVFYYRMPDQRKGVVSGMLLKEPPAIEGDGEATIAELIYRNKILKNNYESISQRHLDVINKVLPKGQTMVLSDASNRSQGARLQNLNSEIDQELCNIFDEISIYSKHFFYGRFDIKCRSLEYLRQGKEFSILEYNGAGAGIQHVYGNGLSLFQACKMIIKHWEKLYQISDYNRRHNQVSYWEFKKGRMFLSNAMKHLKKLKGMDEKFPV